MSATTLSNGRTAAAKPRANPRAAGRRPTGAPLPRRLSGPVAGRQRAVPARQQGASVSARALAVVRSLPEHSLVDRLVRGRAWIPVLGVLLAGIIAMQVEILKLGTTLGRSIQRSATLQSKNESLQASIATLGDDQRIERLAAAMGMLTPSPGLLTFVGAHPQHQIAGAIANIHAPDPSGFAAQLAAQAATASLMAPSSSSTSSSQLGGTQSTTGSTTASTTGSTTTSTTGSTPGIPGSSAAAQTPVNQTGASQTGSAPTTTGQSTGATTSTGSSAPTVATGPSTASSSGAGTGTVAATGAAGLTASGSAGG